MCENISKEHGCIFNLSGSGLFAGPRAFQFLDIGRPIGMINTPAIAPLLGTFGPKRWLSHVLVQTLVMIPAPAVHSLWALLPGKPSSFFSFSVLASAWLWYSALSLLGSFGRADWEHIGQLMDVIRLTSRDRKETTASRDGCGLDPSYSVKLYPAILCASSSSHCFSAGHRRRLRLQ